MADLQLYTSDFQTRLWRGANTHGLRFCRALDPKNHGLRLTNTQMFGLETCMPVCAV